MKRETQIFISGENYHVLQNDATKAWELYQVAGSGTHSVRVATIGIALGLERLKAEIAKRNLK